MRLHKERLARRRAAQATIRAEREQLISEEHVIDPLIKHPIAPVVVPGNTTSASNRLLAAFGIQSSAHWPTAAWMPHSGQAHWMFPELGLPVVLCIAFVWLCWNAGRVLRKLLTRWHVLSLKPSKRHRSAPLAPDTMAPWDRRSEKIAKPASNTSAEQTQRSTCTLDAMTRTSSTAERGAESLLANAGRLHVVSQPGFAYGPSLMLFVYVASLLLLPASLIFAVMRTSAIATWVPIWLTATVFFIISSVVAPICYAKHFARLVTRDGSPNATQSEWPLVHAVVITSRDQPFEMIRRTCESVAEQSAIGFRPWIVIAGDVLGDHGHVKTELENLLGNRIGQIFLRERISETELLSSQFLHSLAAHDLHQQLVLKKGIDPFKVMVTLVDAGSLLSSSYLGHVEQNYYHQEDGGNHIYVAPLVSHHSFPQGSLLTQTYEIMRSHNSIFFDPYMQNAPQSNCSLTLGCMAEVNLWGTSSGSKAKSTSQHDFTTTPVESFIFGSPASSLCEAYENAKQQVDIMALVWQVSCAGHTSLTDALLTMLKVTRCAGLFTLKVAAFFMLCFHWAALPWNVKLCALSGFGLLTWHWVCFWMAELVLWQNVLNQPLIVGQGIVRWALMIVCSPVLMPIAHVIFNIMPTLHGLCTAAWTRSLRPADGASLEKHDQLGQVSRQKEPEERAVADARKPESTMIVI